MTVLPPLHLLRFPTTEAQRTALFAAADARTLTQEVTALLPDGWAVWLDDGWPVYSANAGGVLLSVVAYPNVEEYADPPSSWFVRLLGAGPDEDQPVTPLSLTADLKALGSTTRFTDEKVPPSGEVVTTAAAEGPVARALYAAAAVHLHLRDELEASARQQRAEAAELRARADTLAAEAENASAEVLVLERAYAQLVDALRAPEADADHLADHLCNDGVRYDPLRDAIVYPRP